MLDGVDRRLGSSSQLRRLHADHPAGDGHVPGGHARDRSGCSEDLSIMMKRAFRQGSRTWPRALQMKSAQAGQSIVELALGLTVMLLLVVGIVEFAPAV